jgi:thiol-disulfide isomerase/thioredoxin
MRRASRLLLLLSFAVPGLAAQTPAPAANSAPAANTAPAASQTPAYLSDHKFLKALAAAKEPHLPTDEKLSRWKKANKIAGNGCIDCLEQMIALDAKIAEWKDEVTAALTLEQAAIDPKDKYFAFVADGNALLHYNSDKPKPDQLKQADAAFQSALAIEPTSTMALYGDGRALAMLGRNDDARAVFTRYLDSAKPRDVYRTRVEHFAADPHLAALSMAPAFTIKTTDGQEFSLDNMMGKVVLLDFWASWCGPCRETLPEVKHVVEKFADQPLLVLSISIDKDPDAWKKAMAEEGMTWPQYRDADGRLASAYAAQSIPRFFTIDSDGALQSVQVGSDANIEGSLRKLLARATDTQRQKALATDKPAGQ